MKNEGCQEAGYCSKIVWTVASMFVCAQKKVILLMIRLYYWGTNAPSANSDGGQITKKSRGT
jgi:hypothetical protein